jgi:hypothetical protein
MTGTAKHHPSLVKKAVAAYETGETDRHIGMRGVTLPVGYIYRIRGYQSVLGVFGNEFAFRCERHRKSMPARKRLSFHTPDVAVD